MTPRRLASLCFRVLALVVLADMLGDLYQSLQFLGWTLTEMLRTGFTFGAIGQMGFMIVGPALQLLFAAWLWRKSGVAAAWLFGYDLQDEPDEPDREPAGAATGLDPDVAQAIAFGVLGAWVLADALPEMVRFLGTSVFVADRVPAELRPQMSRNTLALAAALALRLALGFWLLFGSHGIVRILRRLRGIGLETAGDRGGS